MTRERTPWTEWLRRALGAGLSPEMFWRLSLCEWRALMARGDAAAMPRAVLEALCAQFPDEAR